MFRAEVETVKMESGLLGWVGQDVFFEGVVAELLDVEVTRAAWRCRRDDIVRPRGAVGCEGGWVYA